MMKILTYLIFALFFSNIYAQPNCAAFIYLDNDTVKYNACKKAEQVEGHYQFTETYQKILDESIKIDSTYAYAYRKKSTAYLKSGDFINWKRLMDKAVEFNPEENLEYRGLMLFRCFRDYEGALKDFDMLDSLGMETDYLGQARALCYKSLGQPEKAIQIFETQKNEGAVDFGLYGYLHLGVLYLEQGNFEKALQSFLKQSEANEIAENQFYLALTYKGLKLNFEYIEHLKKAKELYLAERRMFQFYIDPIDKIYLVDIENELELVYDKNSFINTAPEK